MRIHTTPSPNRITLVLISILLAASTAIGAMAQPGMPLDSSGQVIAHGIATLPGGAMTWRLGVLTAAPGTTADFGSFDTGFAVSYQQPVITTRLPSGESTYLQPGQATFHSNGTTMRVASTSPTDAAFLNIDLTTDEFDPGATWIGDAFTTPAGTHQVSLTSGIMQAGENDGFVADNDLPYMVVVFTGALQLTDSNGVASALAEGDAIQLSGTTILQAEGPNGAHWLIASIGAEVDVPPLPTPAPTAMATPATDGSLIINLFRCPNGTDPLVAPTECVVADVLWEITISPQGNDDPAVEQTLTTNAVAISDTSFRFAHLAPGTWVIRPDMSWMDIDQRFEMTGNIVPLGGIWGVQISAGEEAEINVYLIDPTDTSGTGDLILEMYECPPGSDPIANASTCALTAEVPNLEVSRITQAEMIIYNTLGDADSPEPGVLILESIPSGLYMLIVEDGGLWTADAVTMLGDVTWDHGFWVVSVPADGSAYVSIYHSLPTTTDPDVAVGTLLITQIDCPIGVVDPTSDQGCYPSESPWDVVVTNVVTTQEWTLFADAILAMPGSWSLELPAGDYAISVVSLDTWTVTYIESVTVVDGGIVRITVYSVASDQP